MTESSFCSAACTSASLKGFALGALALVLSACAGGGSPFETARVNYAAGSELGRALSSREVDALAAAFVPAISNGASGKSAVWSSGSYSGSVTPGEYFVANLKPDPAMLLPVEGRIEFNDPLQTERGLFVLKGDANLRAGPSMEARVITKLDGGTPADGVGKTVGKPWMLVAINGVVRGYVHESLIVKAPGSELELAGGPTRRAQFCRAFSQTLTLFAQTDHWQGVACDRGEGWRLEPAPVPAPSM